MEDQPIHCHIREKSPIARVAAFKLKSQAAAVTLGRTIHLWNTDREVFLGDKLWLRHELCHVHQFRRYGFLRFSLLYFFENLRHGYEKNKFEQQARIAESSGLPDENLFEFS